MVTVIFQNLVVAINQRIQSLHIPPCHRRMVIATILSVHRFALLHRSATQTKCCLEFRMLPSFSYTAARDLARMSVTVLVEPVRCCNPL